MFLYGNILSIVTDYEQSLTSNHSSGGQHIGQNYCEVLKFCEVSVIFMLPVRPISYKNTPLQLLPFIAAAWESYFTGRL